MLTAAVPLPNQADVVLVSRGITASIPAISLMVIPLCQKLCSIKVTATSTLSAQDFGAVIRMVLRLLSRLFFFISPSYVNSAAIVLDGEDSDEEDVVPMEEDVDWFLPLPPPSAPMLPPSLPAIPSPINGTGQAETVVYKGVMPDGLTHTVRRQDGTGLNVHNAHLCLKMQADLTNIPQTSLDYCKEVKKGYQRRKQKLLLVQNFYLQCNRS